MHRISQAKFLPKSFRYQKIRFYHSYPDPNETPIVTQYQVKPKEKSKKSPQMIEQIANLNARFGFLKSSNPQSTSNEKISIQKRELIPQITKLENGLTVVSVEADDMTMSSFVFLIKSGR